MINLLPPVEKEAISFARYNTQLRRWIFGALIGLVGVVVVVGAGQMILQQSANSYSTSIAESKKLLEEQKQTETLQRVKGIQESFTLVIDVLSREVLFSKLLPQVGKVMPEGTVLENLSLNTDEAETAFDLTAQAKDYNSASQIQVNLTDPANGLFQKADLVNVSCPSQLDADSAPLYRCTVSMRVLPDAANQFLLISKGPKS